MLEAPWVRRGPPDPDEHCNVRVMLDEEDGEGDEEGCTEDGERCTCDCEGCKRARRDEREAEDEDGRADYERDRLIDAEDGDDE